MDYSEVLGTSFRLAWRYKALWLFGLFAGGGIGSVFSWTNSFGKSGDGEFGGEAFTLQMDWLVPAVIATVALIVLAQLALTAISTPALIDAVNRLTRGGAYSFGQSLSTGVDFIWRMLGAIILEVASYAGGITFLVVVGLLFGIGAATVHPILIVVVVLVGLPVVLAMFFFIATTFSLGFRALVVRNVGIIDALAEGAALLRQFPGPCAVFFLIYIGITIGVAIFQGILFLMIGGPLYLLLSAAGLTLVPILFIGIPILWVTSLPVSGYLGTVFQTMYTIFYFRLVEPRPSVAPIAGAQPGPAV